jgi:hypothetical protein
MASLSLNLEQEWCGLRESVWAILSPKPQVKELFEGFVLYICCPVIHGREAVEIYETNFTPLKT